MCRTNFCRIQLKAFQDCHEQPLLVISWLILAFDSVYSDVIGISGAVFLLIRQPVIMHAWLPSCHSIQEKCLNIAS